MTIADTTPRTGATGLVDRDSLLNSNVEAFVNTVNTIGVMGKGLALQFKQRFPSNFEVYAAACRRGEVQVGRMLIVETTERAGLRFIINFPTKKHWINPSRIEYVRSGLVALVNEVKARGIQSIAVPPLGCGNGGLAWSDVKPLIDRAVVELPGVRVLVFSPGVTKDLHVRISTVQLKLPF